MIETFGYKGYEVRKSLINGTNCYIVNGYSYIFTTLKMTKDFIKWLTQQKKSVQNNYTMEG